MRVLIFLSGLKTGGAERQVALLARGLAEAGDEVTVATILPGGKFSDEITRGPYSIKQPSLFPHSNTTTVRWSHLLLAPLRLRSQISRYRPDIVYSWLEVGNLVATIGCPKSTPLVWSIRSEKRRCLSWRMKLIHTGLACLAHRTDGIISNSISGLADAAHLWSRISKTRYVVHNGIETISVTSPEETRQTLRQRWKVDSDSYVIGNIARAVPEKGHLTLISAIEFLRSAHPNVVLVCITSGDSSAIEFISKAGHDRLGTRFRCVTDGVDGKLTLHGFDAFCLPSHWGEGFSNALAEAMAAGLPCVATDCGDNAHLIREYGKIVPPEDPITLAHALGELINSSDEPGHLSVQQDYIKKNFSPIRMISETRSHLEEIVRSKSSA